MSIGNNTKCNRFCRFISHFYGQLDEFRAGQRHRCKFQYSNNNNKRLHIKNEYTVSQIEFLNLLLDRFTDLPLSIIRSMLMLSLICYLIHYDSYYASTKKEREREKAKFI